jgi:hypothetical protein
MCINVFFDTVISNYIKPHIKKRHRMETPGVCIRLVDVSVVKLDPIVSRYTQMASILEEESYYRVVKFGELGKSEC